MYDSRYKLYKNRARTIKIDASVLIYNIFTVLEILSGKNDRSGQIALNFLRGDIAQDICA